MEPETIILTGARGRLASAIAPGLGKNVVSVSRTGGGGCILYEDLFQSGLLARPGVVLHCAWSSVPASSEHHPEGTWTEDLPLMAGLLSEIAKAPAKVRPLFVFFSSGGAIYGERQTPAIETDETAPHGWYGMGKLAGEHLLGSFATQCGLETCSLRISNPYGFSFTPEKPQGIVGAALRAVKTGHPMTLLGAGASKKDFFHIDDLTSALQAVIAERPTGCFNICSGHSTPITEMLAMIETVVGRKVPVSPVPAAAWDVQSSLLSREKFESATGWVPRWELEAGVASVVSAAMRAEGLPI
jgi:UDP-glucose 4-epimerase